MLAANALPGMKRNLRFVFAVMFAVAAGASNQQDFDRAYSKYTELLQAGETEQAIPYAKQAMQLGEKVYGKSSENAAKLTFNYGRLLAQHRRREARNVLNRTVNRYEKVYGKNSLELVDPLMERGHTGLRPGQPRQQITHYQRAIEIAAQHGEAELGADLNFDATTELFTITQSQQGRRFLEAAIDGYRSTLGEAHHKTGLATFWLGRMHVARGELNAGSEVLPRALIGIEHGSRLWVAANTQLIEALQLSGRSDEATPYVRALAQANHWDGSSDPVPIFRVRPRYPSNEFRSFVEGDAVVDFTIDAEGFVKNLSLVSTDGSAVFGVETLEVFESWRFIPRMSQGEFVTTEGVRFTVDFVVED